MLDDKTTYEELLKENAHLRKLLSEKSVFEVHEEHQKFEKERIAQKAIIDSTIDLIWAVNSTDFGIITYNNSLYEYFLNGRGIHIKVGDRPEELFPPGDYVAMWKNLYYKALKEGAFSYEYLVFNNSRILRLNFNLLKHNNEIYGISVFGKDVTEQKKVEQELIKAKEIAIESEKQLKALIDNALFPINFTTLDAKAIYLNKAAYKFFNLDENIDLSTINVRDFWVSPEKRNEFAKQVIESGCAVYFENDFYTSDKTVKTVLLSSSIIDYRGENVLFSIYNDITEQKKLERTLIAAKEKAEESEIKIRKQKEEIEFHNERLESLLKITQLRSNSIQELLDFALNEAIILTASKIGYIYFYDEEKRQFILNTWSKEVMAECKVMNPQTIYELDKTGCWGEAVRQRKPIVINDYQSENSLKKGMPAGHVGLKKFLTIPVIFDDKIVAVCGVANKEINYDNSDIRQLSLLMDSVWKISERILLIKDLTLAKEKAEESDRLRSSFMQNMSHEVRTPLNSIAGFSKLMAKPNQSPEKLKMFSELISENSEKLIGIITDVIEISQIHSNITKPQTTEFDVFWLLNDIVNKFKIKAIQKNIGFHLKINIPGHECFIQSDKEKLHRILYHIVDNAIKFTRNGSIDIVCNLKNDNIVFNIIDSGIGITDEMQKIIFEPFRQVETGICRNFGGNGLGLSIVKAYTDLLSGSITLKSEINKGTTFCITIPANKFLDNHI